MSLFSARAVVLACSVCAALAGCGEKPQTSSTRKADAAPSQGGGAAAYTAAGWKKGDPTSWEAQIKVRTESQNEYSRTARK